MNDSYKIYASKDYVDSKVSEISGGVAGNCLPVVTTDNNGAFLCVVDGVWTAVIVSNAEEASF